MSTFFRSVLNVMRRELSGYFSTPVAWVFIVIFLVMAGVFTFYIGSFYERGIADEYLDRLNKLYDEWANNFTFSPVLIIDTNNLNYVQYEEHLEQIWKSIDHRLQGKDFLAL